VVIVNSTNCWLFRKCFILAKTVSGTLIFLVVQSAKDIAASSSGPRTVVFDSKAGVNRMASNCAVVRPSVRPIDSCCSLESSVSGAGRQRGKGVTIGKPHCSVLLCVESDRHVRHLEESNGKLGGLNPPLVLSYYPGLYYLLEYQRKRRSIRM
jgi:hypothetical protein